MTMLLINGSLNNECSGWHETVSYSSWQGASFFPIDFMKEIDFQGVLQTASSTSSLPLLFAKFVCLYPAEFNQTAVTFKNYFLKILYRQATSSIQ